MEIVANSLIHSFLSILNIPLKEGSIGSDVVIKPVPFGLINTDNGDNLRAHHIVYKRKADPIVQLSDFGK